MPAHQIGKVAVNGLVLKNHGPGQQRFVDFALPFRALHAVRGKLPELRVFGNMRVDRRKHGNFVFAGKVKQATQFGYDPLRAGNVKSAR